jgi:hypothetical protein
MKSIRLRQYIENTPETEEASSGHGRGNLRAEVGFDLPGRRVGVHQLGWRNPSPGLGAPAAPLPALLPAPLQ